MSQARQSGSQVYSINHTDHAPLRKRPICAHIETKLSGQDLQNALTQLGVWFRANFARLGELAVESDAEPVTGMPPLLGIIIQGHEWYLHLWFKVGDEVVSRCTSLSTALETPK
jgi:hypothetical protein